MTSENPFTIAAKLIEEHGWIRGYLFTCSKHSKELRGYCLEGALAQAIDITPLCLGCDGTSPEVNGNVIHQFSTKWKYSYILIDVLDAQYRESRPNQTLWLWNDITAQSKEEVIQVLEKAAVKWEEQI